MFKKILYTIFFIFISINAQDNIINELANGGEFIIRDENEMKLVTVPSNGNVGIGNSDPQDKLVITKSINGVKGELRFGGHNGRTITAFENDIMANLDFHARQTYFHSDFLIPSSKKISTANSDPGNLYITTDNPNTAIYTDRNILTTMNIGIGTISPTARLEIAGQIKITGGSPGAGKVLTSDGTGLASWQTPSGGGGGSILWFESGDNVYRSSGNVGIGTSTPSEKLEVIGSAIVGDNSSSSFLHVGNNYFSSNTGILNPGLYLYKNDAIAYGLKLQSTNGEYGTMMFGPNLSNTHLSFGKTGAVMQDDNMVEYMRIDLDNGNVGIGTNTPMVKLDVEGTACVTRYGTKSVNTITNGTWDLTKGNISEVNFGSTISPITISSDNCVGTYVLIVKKANSCSDCSLNIQGVNVMWAYGVPPTLSSGSNTTDIISLIAVGNNNFYGYTANNFF